MGNLVSANECDSGMNYLRYLRYHCIHKVWLILRFV